MADDAVRATARIEMTFGSAAEAKAIQAALSPEDEGWVTSKVEGARLTAEIRADKLGEFLRTVDDYLGGVTAAVRATNAVAEPKASRHAEVPRGASEQVKKSS